MHTKEDKSNEVVLQEVLGYIAMRRLGSTHFTVTIFKFVLSSNSFITIPQEYKP